MTGTGHHTHVSINAFSIMVRVLIPRNTLLAAINDARFSSSLEFTLPKSDPPPSRLLSDRAAIPKEEWHETKEITPLYRQINIEGEGSVALRIEEQITFGNSLLCRVMVHQYPSIVNRCRVNGGDEETTLQYRDHS